MKFLDDFLFRIKHRRYYKYWNLTIKGKEPISFVNKCGYFSTSENVHEVQMNSGLVALCKCVYSDYYGDPNDMVKEAYYHTVGYKGHKLFKDMTFKEYVDFKDRYIRKTTPTVEEKE